MKIDPLKPFISRFLLLTCCIISLLVVIQSCQKEIKNPEAPPSDNENFLSRAGSQNKDVDARIVAENFVSPIGLVALPDRSKDDDHHYGHGYDNGRHNGDDHDRNGKNVDKRLFVIDQVGKIWILDKWGNRLAEPFLDITSKLVPLSPGYDERGLLGLAFHPNYNKNGKFYIYYTAPPRAGGPQPGSSWNNLSRISEFRVSSNPNKADLGSERVLLQLDDPQSNHNGGTIAFGPDDYLYIAIGDGGGANDVGPGHVEDWYRVNPGGNGQDVEANLFGNILRIDVNRIPYGIPRDNPFVGRRGKDEIYAYGFRNPFRFSFDMGGSHSLIAGDAGQVLYEEIDLVRKGQNYGWNVREGRHCFNATNNSVELASCPLVDPFGNPLIDPVIEINNTANPKGGRALTIIGGNVYRGDSIPQFNGKYIFGTFAQTAGTPNGELFMAQPSGQRAWSFQEIMLKSSPNDIGYYLKGFGQDNEGEIYLTVSRVLGPTGTTGKILKLVGVKSNKKDLKEY